MEEYQFDPSLNVFFRSHRELDFLFFPKNVALIGATDKENSVGKTIMLNLMNSDFGGKLYPVNPKKEEILGIKAFSDVRKIPVQIDLAVIVTPAKTVPEIVLQCSEAKIPTAIIISAGFKELGEKGRLLEEEVLKNAKKTHMRIVGPNCLGVMNPISGLNATFAASMALKGDIAFISQSGALCTAVLDWSLKEKVGFSAFVSIGSMADVDWGDLISYLGTDPHTKSILIYMESIGDPRAFLSAAREAALTKPIILIKAGVTEESAKAAASHTGSLAGSNDVFNAALNRVGVLRVETISELFSLAEILAKQPLPKGPNLTVITNAGGPGVIATDALIKNGAKLTKLDPKILSMLNQILPEAWSHGNPVDVLGDASPELYAAALQTASLDSNSNGILVILTPQYMTDATKTAIALKNLPPKKDQPLFASWMGASAVEKGKEILKEAKIPVFSYPDEACKTFAYMWAYNYNLQGLYETPQKQKEIFGKDPQERKKSIEEIFQKAYKENRTILTEFESKKVLDIFGIPVVPTFIAKTKEEAVFHAKKIGFPIVLKLFSETITHKTDVKGVKLNLLSDLAVIKAYDEIFASVKQHVGEQHFQGVTVQPMISLDGYELIFGSSIDKEFGPVLVFGSGGQYVEVYKDKALGLPPLTSTLARRMMQETKIYKALLGFRGKKAVDLSKLEEILVRFSYLIAEFPQIQECDINPLLASSENILALDARIILQDPKIDQKKWLKMAIRPYPSQYVREWELPNTLEKVLVRPIRPDDEPLIKSFLKDLSERTVQQRYLKILHYDELSAHDRMIKICFNDYDREIALVVEKGKEILAIGRLTKLSGSSTEATFALIVQDRWQHHKLGSRLLHMLLEIAKDEKIEKIIAKMLPENKEMQKICEKESFSLSEDRKEKLIIAEWKNPKT